MKHTGLKGLLRIMLAATFIAVMMIAALQISFAEDEGITAVYGKGKVMASEPQIPRSRQLLFAKAAFASALFAKAAYASAIICDPLGQNFDHSFKQFINICIRNL